jgi:hypothetical protein
MNDLFRMPQEPCEPRWFSFENTTGAKGEAGKARCGRKGSPSRKIPAGESVTLVDAKGSGTVRRIWVTFGPRDPEELRGVKIEMYWDGAKTPAVQAPVGDFFCHSMGHMVTFENTCFSSPEGRSFNCVIPMPFRESARIVLTNESPKELLLYYDVDLTMGEKHGGDVLYFHSYWRRENLTKLREDVQILPRIEGQGRFLGCNIGVRVNPALANFWWGEGEVKVYLDGDKAHPTLCGTGTEDYIGTGWGQGHYFNRYQGCHFRFQPEGSPRATMYGFYRFHVPDPIFFRKDIKVTIQDMGGPNYCDLIAVMDKDPSMRFMKPGDGTQYYTREELEKEPEKFEEMERTDDFSTTAYWYMDKPENGLPPLAPVAERTADLP